MSQHPKPSPTAAPEKRVLFIDDSEELLSLMEMALQGSGFKVLTTSTGRTGLEILASQPIDLVVLDYAMPDMDGEAVAREIRRLSPLTPIIMYSGGLEEIPRRALELVDEFVSKEEPITTLFYYIPRVSVRRDRPRRGSPRYRMQVPFFAFGPGDSVLQGQSSDLSRDGMSGVLQGALEPGTLVRLEIRLPSEVAVHTRAIVRHKVGARYGFQFLDPTTIEIQSIKSFPTA